MRDADIDLVCKQAEAILATETIMRAPQLAACFQADGWLPIASLLNYSPLGKIVWPFGGVGVVADCLNKRGSHLIELSDNQSCVRQMSLDVQLRRAIEYIFSDHNFHRDVHLQLLLGKDGFVGFDKLLPTYPSLQQLTSSKHVSDEMVCAHALTAPRMHLAGTLLRPSQLPMRSPDLSRARTKACAYTRACLHLCTDL